MAKKQSTQPIEEIVPHIQHHWANPLYDKLMDANEAATHLENVREKKGVLNQYTLLSDSRPEDSPFHHFFEWCEEVAAEKWRLHQALNIINAHRTVRVDVTEISGEVKTIESSAQPVEDNSVKTYHRCDVKIKEPDGKIHFSSDYRTYNNVVMDKVVLSQVRDDAFGRMMNFQRTFATLSNDDIIGPVIEAMNLAFQKEKAAKQQEKENKSQKVSPGMASA